MSIYKLFTIFCLFISTNSTSISTSELGKGTGYTIMNIGNAVKISQNIVSSRTNSINKVMYSPRDHQISVIENLPELRSVFMDKVRQEIIPEFQNVPKLTDVYMQSNEFVFIKQENFGYTNAVYIFLRFNKIYQIEDNSFGPKVKHVYLQCNNLRHVSPEWFQNKAIVNVLDLDENDIEYIEDNTFKDFKKLEYLYLVANGLKQIGDGALSGARFISELWLGTNELTELSASVFGDKPIKFERLDISYNKLTFLTQDFFDRVNVTVSISLDDNPWQCSCYFYHVIPWGGARITADKQRIGEPRCVGEDGPLVSSRCKNWVDHKLIDIYSRAVSPSLRNKDKICTQMII